MSIPVGQKCQGVFANKHGAPCTYKAKVIVEGGFYCHRHESKPISQGAAAPISVFIPEDMPKLTDDEIWAYIGDEFPSYMISTKGRVGNKAGRISGAKPASHGYVSVSITDRDGARKHAYAHILVAKTFIPNPEDKAQVDHIDSIRDNNDVTNLQWVTPSENLLKKSKPSIWRNKCKVIQYNLDGTFCKLWDSITIIENSLKGYWVRSISKACRDGGSYNGYYWRYNVEVIEGEKWMQCKVGDTIVSVSDKGRIWLTGRHITYGSKDIGGYMRIFIEKKNYSVHRLICQAFKPIANPESMYVNHIDCVKDNNKVENLEWVTASENTTHFYKFKMSTTGNGQHNNAPEEQ